jgi:hypothetical protein
MPAVIFTFHRFPLFVQERKYASVAGSRAIAMVGVRMEVSIGRGVR